jgi:16S rRNA (adenine1518-N6/adenine1519-N6)-dimethyltransferase
MSKPIQTVDEHDRPVGTATKQEAWEKGLAHRIVRIMLHDKQGRVLLQHRSPTKDIFPDCWDNSAAGHVDAGEDYLAAAIREVEEELGLTGVELTEIGYYRTDETWKGHRFNRFTRCYRGKIDQTPQKLEAGKVDDVRWFTVDDVRRLIKNHPDKVSDGLLQVFARYY